MLMNFRIDHGIFARQMVSSSRLAEACSEPHLPVIRPHYARTPGSQIGRIPARLCLCKGGSVQRRVQTGFATYSRQVANEDLGSSQDTHVVTPPAPLDGRLSPQYAYSDFVRSDRGPQGSPCARIACGSSIRTDWTPELKSRWHLSI